MRLRAVLRVMRMEIGQLNLLNLLILVGSTILMFYPLVTSGLISIGSRISLEEILVSGDPLITGDEVVMNLNRLAYLERKLYILVRSGIFGFTHHLLTVWRVSIEPMFLILGVAAYVSMEASSMLRPGVFKRYMTLPITRDEYFVGRILFNVVMVAFYVTSTYFVVGSIFYRPDSSLLLASIMGLPELILMSSIAFSVALVVRREIPAFILSSAVLYMVFTQLVIHIERWLTRSGNPQFGEPTASPFIGYVALLGILDELEREGFLGGLMMSPYGIPPYVDAPGSLVALSVYLLVILGLSLMVILLAAYFLRRVEVD